MASAYAKRLAKLEELLASRINQPHATLWQHAGETQEECCIRRGYDPLQASKIRFVRWLDPALGEAPPEFSWDVPEPGPPSDDAGQTVRRAAQRSEIGETPVARTFDDLEEAESRYREAIKQREAEIVQEKVAEATATVCQIDRVMLTAAWAFRGRQAAVTLGGVGVGSRQKARIYDHKKYGSPGEGPLGGFPAIGLRIEPRAWGAWPIHRGNT